MSGPRRPRMKSAVSAGALIEKMLKERGFEGKLREYRAWQVWDDVVGPQIALRARPIRIRDGVLEVRVDQPVWMQQLQLMKPKLLARLNDRLEGAPIRDLYLRRGRIDRVSPQPAPSPTWKDIPLSEEEFAAIDSALESVEDPALKQVMRGLFTRQAKAAKISRP